MLTAFVLLLILALLLGLARLPRAAGPSADPPRLPAQFVVFDLETTGLDPSRHEIVEIGAIRVASAPNPPAEFQRLVKPRKRIPKKIASLTGITQRMLDRDGEDPSAALAAFLQFAGDLPLVAFNAQFDMAFLRRAAGRKAPIRNQVICALRLARRTWPGQPSYKLANLTAQAMPDEAIHRALPDCRRALRLYRAAAAGSAEI